MKLLGVPKLPNGTGEAQATAVFNLLEDWNISDRVQLMAFDTTSSNAGKDAGACTLLEKKLGKMLLSLACRHHIMELIVSKVFDTVMSASTGPNTKLFKRFADYCPNIDRRAAPDVASTFATRPGPSGA